ncbi:MAG: LysR family transcriptional regulator [Nocardioides sp.]|nr:LysR family transcriptional regulator [Nocardioides sp.]
MNLNDLKTCLLLAEEQHFGRAASRAHLTQPAVSQALKRLEREYGVQLFDRSSRGVRPTPAGAAMMPHIRALVERAQTLQNLARERSGANATSVTVGFPAVLRPVMRRMSSRLVTLGADLCVVPRLGPAAEHRVGLLEGSLDVALLPEALIPAGHASVALPPVRLSVLTTLRTTSAVGLGGLLVPDVRDAAVVRPPDPSDLRRAGHAGRGTTPVRRPPRGPGRPGPGRPRRGPGGRDAPRRLRAAAPSDRVAAQVRRDRHVPRGRPQQGRSRHPHPPRHRGRPRPGRPVLAS